MFDIEIGILGLITSHAYRTPSKIADLDKTLVTALRTGSVENVFLTPPDTLNNQEHRGFRYMRERKSDELHSDLRIEELLTRVVANEITLDALNKWRVREYTTSEDTPSRLGNPVQRGHRFQRKADSNPVIADSR